LGISLAHGSSQTSIQIPGLPRENFQILPGSDEQGITRTTELLFSQEWLSRTTEEVFGVRSQFGLGTDWFNATINSGDAPDSQFFFWRGQAQWIQRFGQDNLLIARSAIQLADRPLLSRQRIGIGGPNNVRGYPVDQTLTDNGFWLSLEAQIPIATVPEIESNFRIAPFLDYGRPWNNSRNQGPALSHLAAVGVGTIWQIEDRMTARLDWGIPLTRTATSGNSLQQSGVTFAIVFSPF
ncbi:hemolysin activation/secretion protein, partial [filamentous cyanobacterium CCP5]